MLTGDKVETAENIAYSCKLLTDSSKVIKLKSLFKNDLARELSTALENVIYEDV